MHLLSLVLASLLGGEPVLDDFRYVAAASARAAWVVAEGSPPVEVVDEDRPVMRLPAPFASQPKLPRVVADRRMRLDLVSAGGFLLEAAVDDPQSVGSLTLYFRSGDGWYASSLPIDKKGRQTFRFSKTSFQKEGKPAGWEKIDGIRLSCWRGQGADVRDSAVAFRRLTAVTQQTVVVLPARKSFKQEGEFRGVRSAAQTVVALMEDLGVKADEIDEDAVSVKSLGQRRVAILPHNPMLGNECAEVLTKFVNAGGKLVVCYTLHPRLATALGFGNPKWVGQQRPGQFAEMRFDAADVAGLPKSVRQGSWNITTAEPAGHNARVIGRWFDDAGKPTGHPAALLSDRGVFLSHVVLADDGEGKKQLLAALLGHFDSSLWKQIAQTEIERADHVGHCANLEEIAAYASKATSPQSRRLSFHDREPVESRGTMLQQAKQRLAQRTYAEAADLARAAHESLARAYLLATPSREHEGRAMWNHSGTGAYPGDWERSAKLLAENGFNMILPNMLWGGVAHYASDVLPRSATFRAIRRPDRAVLRRGEEARPRGPRLEGQLQPGHRAQGLCREAPPRRPHAGDRQGRAAGLALPVASRRTRSSELESLLEVARKYPVDGLHFDYIRYPDGDCCYLRRLPAAVRGR